MTNYKKQPFELNITSEIKWNQFSKLMRKQFKNILYRNSNAILSSIKDTVLNISKDNLSSIFNETKERFLNQGIAYTDFFETVKNFTLESNFKIFESKMEKILNSLEIKSLTDEKYPEKLFTNYYNDTYKYFMLKFEKFHYIYKNEFFNKNASYGKKDFKNLEELINNLYILIQENSIFDKRFFEFIYNYCVKLSNSDETFTYILYITFLKNLKQIYQNNFENISKILLNEIFSKNNLSNYVKNFKTLFLEKLGLSQILFDIYKQKFPNLNISIENFNPEEALNNNLFDYDPNLISIHFENNNVVLKEELIQKFKLLKEKVNQFITFYFIPEFIENRGNKYDYQFLFIGIEFKTSVIENYKDTIIENLKNKFNYDIGELNNQIIYENFDNFSNYVDIFIENIPKKNEEKIEETEDLPLIFSSLMQFYLNSKFNSPSYNLKPYFEYKYQLMEKNASPNELLNKFEIFSKRLYMMSSWMDGLKDTNIIIEEELKKLKLKQIDQKLFNSIKQ